MYVCLGSMYIYTPIFLVSVSNQSQSVYLLICLSEYLFCISTSLSVQSVYPEAHLSTQYVCISVQLVCLCTYLPIYQVKVSVYQYLHIFLPTQLTARQFVVLPSTYKLHLIIARFMSDKHQVRMRVPFLPLCHLLIYCTKKDGS